MNITNEETFESNIEKYLIDHGGYFRGDNTKYQAEIGMDTTLLFKFIQTTQKESWDALEEIHGDDTPEKFIQRLIKELDIKGTIKVLREGIDNSGVHFDLAYFQPESSLNPESAKRYDQNLLSVTRQIHFSNNEPDKSVDVVLFLNGLPIVTMELKNPLTGQDVKNAVKQYKNRNFKETLFRFKRGAIVHFSVDPHLVYMSTKLKGADTKFLPFNKGSEDGGAGNPPAPEASEGQVQKYKTSYLWEEILKKDSLMEIIKKFIHLETKEFKVNGKNQVKENLIFPRYHQLDVVRKLTKDTKEVGVGKNYLIQHSAGSGKSNSIAWLAYRLSSLHDEFDKNIFDSVIVVTDRVVLDKQLQNTIYQFDHTTGVVKRIDKNSKQLGDALEAGVKIIITTVQKFPFILGKIGDLSDKKYAVIVDEAHSSQGGETSTDLKAVLSQNEVETEEDLIVTRMKARGKQNNLNFYAFTATPKAKTIEVFGVKAEDGKPQPFHLYSMRQAIEEGFILDVLQNYITYKRYFKISKEIDEDPELSKQKANVAIARYVNFHPTNLSQKSEVIIEHFRYHVMGKIGGKAKAMVVTGSRMHAYKFYLAFKKYIKEKGYDEIKPLVAFSGKLTDEDTGIEVTESKLNGIKESELPEKFNTDEYKVLLVADKYQTGFDEPLLHTMYVDKKLSGLQAVQTLSRLNRTHENKEDTMVLDFVNTAEDIYDAFKPYYEMTVLKQETDPNAMYDLKNKLQDSQLFNKEDIEAFADIFYKSLDKQDKEDQPKLYAIVEPSLERFKEFDKDKQGEFRSDLNTFIRLYSFLTQIVPFTDASLEKFYTYSRYLRKVLPKEESYSIDIDDDVVLSGYRLTKISEGKIILNPESKVEIGPSVGTAGANKDDEKERLSEIIKAFNERFGEGITEADVLQIEQGKEEILDDFEILEQAKNNSKDNFMLPFKDKVVKILIDRIEKDEEFTLKAVNDEKILESIVEYYADEIYRKIQKQDIKALILEGESNWLEFKSTLRWDVRESQVNKGLEGVILKTIVGFMNAEGGKLIIGVEDDGNIYGLSNDYKALGNADRDKFENHVIQIIKSHVGVEYIKYLNIYFDAIDGEDVCLVTVVKSEKPAFVDDDEFYLRTGNNTSKLKTREATDYISNHWR